MPDLILADLSMPQLDGWGMLRELRADERTRHIPCIAVTAFIDRERARNFKRKASTAISRNHFAERN